MQAYDAGMLFPRYIWITYSRDYSAACGDGCNAAEFLNGVFSVVSTASVTLDRTSIKQVQYAWKYSHTLPQGPNWLFYDFDALATLLFSISQEVTAGFTSLAYFAYDAVLTLATALSSSELLDPVNLNISAPVQNVSVKGITASIATNLLVGVGIICLVCAIRPLHQWRPQVIGYLRLISPCFLNTSPACITKVHVFTCSSYLRWYVCNLATTLLPSHPPKPLNSSKSFCCLLNMTLLSYNTNVTGWNYIWRQWKSPAQCCGTGTVSKRY